jgi:hypothetical protein
MPEDLFDCHKIGAKPHTEMNRKAISAASFAMPLIATVTKPPPQGQHAQQSPVKCEISIAGLSQPWITSS